MVLTNFHVMEPVITRKDGGTGECKAVDVEILFDYKHAADGEKNGTGIVIRFGQELADRS